MKTSTKTALIIATVALVLGICLAGIGISTIGSDFKDMAIKSYSPVTYGVSESFTNISVNTDVHDISFILSENDGCKVICSERERITHAVTVENDTLTIKTVTSKKWFDYIGIFPGKATITVYLPTAEYGSVALNTDTGDIDMPKDFSFGTVKIKTDTGDISWHATVSDDISIKGDTGNVAIKDISPATIKIETDTGDISVTNVTVEEDISVSADTGDVFIVACSSQKKVNVKTSTGDITLTRCNAKETLDIKASTGNVTLANTFAEELNIKTSTGDVTFNNADAENISVVTDTGNVKGTLATEKIFITSTDTGRISLPRTTSGGICEITTSTGNINIDIAEN